MKKTFIIAIFLSMMVLVSGSKAWASYASATSTVDLSGLTTIFGDISAYTIDAATNAYWYSNVNPGVSNTSPSPSGYYASVLASDGSAAAAASISLSSVSATSMAQNVVGGATQVWSAAVAGVSGTFTYNGPDVTIASLPYALSYDLNASAPSDIQANAFASAELKLAYDGYYVTIDFNQPSYITFSVYTGGSKLSPDQTIAFLTDAALHAGDSGTFSLNAYADTSATKAPIPAAIWLLGSGIVGLAGIKRRKLFN